MATKKNIKVRDLKPRRDAKGGGAISNTAGSNTFSGPGAGKQGNLGNLGNNLGNLGNNTGNLGNNLGSV